ncbi:olfactory receptor-like protein OLF4 [Periophthalmus magnuspinnatus]|uniref:olfactory receptor-like protein OLF4 n=1 Tax=Periophthalmus magnuspinnatus TaxID=409849 RepID=UPI00145A3603|nr:olfactory receptor-like protein OLF4 [Periophthalmus magnuspinnatus]
MDNASAVRLFTLSGLNETMPYRVTLFSLTLAYYCVILFANIFLIVIIVLDSNLHEPMYILLCSFCFNALYGTAGFYPKFLIDLQTTSPEISYDACLLQAFIMYSFACSDLSILAVMAYDRYLAICQPLHYHSIMTKKRLSQLICISWLTPWCIFALNVILTSQLQLCGAHIQRMLCVNWVIVKLACPKANVFPNSVTAYCTMFIYTGHGVFVVWTYMHMIKTCIRSKDDRVKFMQTCVPHLTSMLTFVCTILFDLMHMRFGPENLPQHLKNFIAIEFILVPPFVNPLIYGFKLTKIRNRIEGIFCVKSKLHLPAQTGNCS